MLKNLFGSLLFIVLCIVQTHNSSPTTDEKQEIEFDASIQAELERIVDLRERAARGFQKIFKKVYAKGYADGQDSAESYGFLASFECAASSSIALLEKGYKKGEYLCTNDLKLKYREKLQFPKDILGLIRENEPWIVKYEEEIEKLEYEKSENRQLKFPSTSASSVPKERKPLEERIKHSFITWYAIMTAEHYDAFLPVYVKELKLKLISLKNMNLATYKDKSIFLRFAAHMALCFKMMCALQHAARNSLRPYSEKHPEVDFTELLFELIPAYHITEEQVIFLNFLRDCLPTTLSPILHVCVKNPSGECRIVPYVNSENCGRLSKKKLIDPKKVSTLATPPRITVIHNTLGII